MQAQKQQEAAALSANAPVEKAEIQTQNGGRLSTRERRTVALLCALGVCMSLLYAILVHPGSCADEPSHLFTVKFYANHHRMPFLGEPEVVRDKQVGFECQMGPVYYTLAAVLYKLALLVGGKFPFYALRCATLLLVIPEVLLVYLITRRLFPRNRSGMIPAATALLFAFNPQLAAVASSIQNDSLAIVFSLLATYLAILWIQDEALTIRHAVALGVIVSLGILTKSTVTFMLVPIPFFAWMVHKRKSLAFDATFVGTVLALAAWWYVRNYMLYGDFTAQKGLLHYGFTNLGPHTNMFRLRAWIFMVWDFQAHYWFPVEYYQNRFHIPIWLRAVALLVTVAAVAGWFWRFRGQASEPADESPAGGEDREKARFTALFVAAEYAVCLAIYVYCCHRITVFAPRSTMTTYIAYASALTAGGVYAFRKFKLSEATYVRVLGVALLAMNAFTLYKVHQYNIILPNPFG